MKGRSRLALLMLALVFACESDQSITGPKSVPIDPSDVIQDGAHGGNPDFWFLPPMVPSPFRHPNFELGTFNNALGPSLRIEICELRNEHLSALGIPTGATRCKADATNPNIDAPPITTFPAGSVNLVNLPRNQRGWWSLFGLPEDGFYYVLWNTRQANLNINKFYRIKVLVAGSDVPLGIADVDPMPGLSQWRHTRTGEVVQMIDNIMLPIPFRVEHGALCEDSDLCTSVTVTNDNDGVDQIVQLDNGSQDPIAGASIPDCVLPGPGCSQEAAPGAPQSFVLTISQVKTAGSGLASNVANISAQSAPTLCHPTLPLKQFEGCFNFTTIPELPAINEAGDVFLNAVTVAVCFELVNDAEDPRVPYVQLFASDPGEPARELPNASDARILTSPGSRDCSSEVGFNNSTGVMGFASAGWRKLQGGLGGFFGVKTAYALDVGIAGLVKKISNVGPALIADIESNSSGELALAPEEPATSSVKIVGRPHHEGDEGSGVAGLAVRFTLGSGEGCDGRLLGTEGNTLSTTTNADGVASVDWALDTPGSCTLTATGQAFGSSTFEATATVPEDVELPLPNLEFVRSEVFLNAAGATRVRYRISVSNYEAYPAAMFAIAPTLPSCAGEGGPPSPRTWVDVYRADDIRLNGFCGFGSPSDLQLPWFAGVFGELPPSQVYIKMVDRLTGAIYESNGVTPVLPDLVVSSGPPSLTPATVPSTGGTLTVSAWNVTNQGGNFATLDGSLHMGAYVSTDPIITAEDTRIRTGIILDEQLQAGESVSRAAEQTTIPPLEPGTYYVGILIDRTNVVPESNEENNYASSVTAVLTVTAPVAQVAFISSPFVGCCANDIYIQRVDGTGRTRLTEQPTSGEIRPRWAPDGSKILFARHGNLYTVNPATQVETLLAEGADQGNYSPDGTKIVFTRGFRLWQMDASGGNQVPLSTAEMDQGLPAYAPDNATIVYMGMGPFNAQNVFRRDPTGVVTQLTTDGFSSYPSFSPDGTKILFESAKSMYTMAPDGSGRVLVRFGSIINGSSLWPTYSPDGNSITFILQSSGSHDIHVLNLVTGGISSLVTPDAIENYPSIRPGNH